MWEYDVHATANRAEERELLEADAEKARAERLLTKEKPPEFDWDKMLFEKAVQAERMVEKEAVIEEAFSRAEKSREQGEFLAASRRALKEESARLDEEAHLSKLENTKSAAPAAGAAMCDVRQSVSGFSPAQSTPELCSEALGQPVIVSEGVAPTSAVPSAQVPLDKESGRHLDGKETVKTSTQSHQKAALQHFGECSGTQNAPKESMSFSAHHENRRDTSRTHDFAFSQDALDGVSRMRLGALVESAQTDFQDVAVRETFITRMQELINRLCAMGQSWARIVVPVDAQTKIIVRFNSSSGRVKIHITAPDKGLAELILSGWKTLTGDVAKNGINVDEPTFDYSNYDN